MNNQKKNILLSGKNKLKQGKEGFKPSKNNIENATNINTYRTTKKNLFKTSTIKNNSSSKNSYNKTNNRKQSSNSINNRKSSKIFKIKTSKSNKNQPSLNLSNNDSFNKNKNKVNKNSYNTINVINPKYKMFKKNDFVITNINRKNKSIQNSSRMNYKYTRYNTFSNDIKGNNDKHKYKSNKNDFKMKQNNNNIIINFFNAPINRYSEEFYFNNINDMNKIIKNKQIKKKVYNIFNHGNSKINPNINLNEKIPIFSNNNYNINNFNNFEFQIYHNKKKSTSNAFDNLKTIFSNHSVSRIKKSPFYKEKRENYSNKYKKIKFFKNKKTKNLSLNIKLKEENKLKIIFKRSKNYNNINTLNKNNIINIKQDHFIRSKTQRKEDKIKKRHILYNLLFKSNLKTEQNYPYKNKSKNILSFNTLNTFKSIDIDQNIRKIPKFNTLITEVHNNNINTKKNIKNKFLKKSKGTILINNNIQNHKKNKDIKTILNPDNSVNKEIILEQNSENKDVIKPKFKKINNIEMMNNSFRNKDPKYLGEYLDEILCNLYLEEKASVEKIGIQISSDILNAYGINPETRTCLIDSLIDLQKIFNFNERTLFITVQLFDKYIALSILKETTPKIKEENLDIILATALLIASKLEESILYKLSDYLGILSDKYTLEDIKIMENKIMDSLDFSAISPTVLDFFEVFAEKGQLNDGDKNRGLFLLNIVLLDINLSQISGSVIAYSVMRIIQGNVNNNKFKSLINILNIVNNSKNNSSENVDTFSLMNNEEKMEELCDLIQVFAEGILKTEYNHISIKFNCQNNDYISKIKSHPSD